MNPSHFGGGLQHHIAQQSRAHGCCPCWDKVCYTRANKYNGKRKIDDGKSIYFRRPCGRQRAHAAAASRSLQTTGLCTATKRSKQARKLCYHLCLKAMPVRPVDFPVVLIALRPCRITKADGTLLASISGYGDPSGLLNIFGWAGYFA